MRRHLRILWHITWQALGYILLPAICALGIVYVISAVQGEVVGQSQIGFVSDICTVVILFLFFFKTRPSYVRDFFSQKLSLSRIGLLIPISIGARLLLAVLVMAIVAIGGESLGNALSEGVEFQWDGVNTDTLLSLIATLGSFVILTPIHEELFFRGAVMGYLKEHYSPKVAILYSTYVFALLHGHPGLYPSTFFLGLILALVYHRWNNIWYPIILHMLINFHPFVIDWVISRGFF